MTIEQAMTTKLATVLGHTRIYPDGAVPQGQDVWPCVIYDHAGDDDRIALGGRRSDVRIDTFTIEVIGPKRVDLATTRDTLKDSFSGANCRGLWGTLFVTGATVRDAQADAVEPDDGSEELYRTERLTLQINWRKQ